MPGMDVMPRVSRARVSYAINFFYACSEWQECSESHHGALQLPLALWTVWPLTLGVGGEDADAKLSRQFSLRHEGIPPHEPAQRPVRGACDPDPGCRLHPVVGY